MGFVGRFDVKPRFFRVRTGPGSKDRTTRFESHLRAPVWCCCPFSLRKLVTCQCCDRTLCFECGGTVNIAILQQEAHDLFNPPDRRGDSVPFDDVDELEKL